MGNKLDPPDDAQAPVRLSKETINHIAAETGVPETIVSNIIAADGRGRSAEEIRDMILDMFQEVGTSGPEPSDAPRQGHITPEEAVGKLERLRNMLAWEPEFEARYPEAYKELFTPPFMGIGGEHREGTGLPLPSFGVRILRSEPKSVVRSRGNEHLADAYSTSYFYREMGEIPIPQSPLRVEKGYLRCILLAVADREEYFERIDPSRRYSSVPEEFVDLLTSFRDRLTRERSTELPDSSSQERIDFLRRPNFSEGDGSGIPEASYVRLTDLRLAYHFPHLHLKEVLILIFDSLEKPLQPEGVVEWKRKTLKGGLEMGERMLRKLERELSSGQEPSAQEKRQREQELEGIPTLMAVVSFATAALCLLLDLGVPGVREASSYRLGEQVEELATIVRDLRENLDRGTDELESLVANRSAGRPLRSEEALYTALVRYRLGKVGSEDLATELGYTPYSSSTGKGTRSWKKRVNEKLARAVEVERSYHPRTAAILANKDDPHIGDKAARAYRTYLAELEGVAGSYPWIEVGREIGVSAGTQRGMEEIRAYVQLGSCLERGIPTPVPYLP